MRAILRNNNNADNDDTINALIDASLNDDYGVFQEFNDKEIHNLCAAVRKPGMQITVNPGVNAPSLGEMRLKLGACAAECYSLVNQPINAQSI